MKRLIMVITMITLIGISCKNFSTPSEPTAIVLDANGFHLDGKVVTIDELTAFMTNKSEKNDTSLITIELLPGHIRDQKFQLKILLKEKDITNIKEIK